MLPQDKAGLLQSFLGALPGGAAARLAAAVEVDRLMDGMALPHADILDSLRPVLCRENPGRTPTPLRLFCRPFQDLLTGAGRRDKQKGVIARASIAPVWHWLSRALLPDAADLYCRETKALILAGKPDAALARAAQFWAVAATAMQGAVTDGGARQALGDAMTLADAAEMALLLAVGDAVEAVSALLPRQAPSFTPQLVWQVRAIHDDVAGRVPDAAPYIAVVAMNRLARPWEALRLPMLMTRKSDETLIAKTDMGLVGDILFARMAALQSGIVHASRGVFDADDLMRQVKSFAALSSNIVKEVEIRRGGEWGKVLLSARAQVGRVMDGLMERAMREADAALPTARRTGADFTRPVAPEKHQSGLRYARLVMGCRDFAAAASFAASQKTAYEALCAQLQRYNEDVIAALKADPGNGAAAAQLQFCTELTAILFSEDEAELLRRRGKAAIVR